jgi:hypothetical protein
MTRLNKYNVTTIKYKRVFYYKITHFGSEKKI